VAVKTVAGEAVDEKAKVSLMREIEILRQCHHEALAAYLGYVCARERVSLEPACAVRV
jgi:hypothetical protein